VCTFKINYLCSTKSIAPRTICARPKPAKPAAIIEVVSFDLYFVAAAVAAVAVTAALELSKLGYDIREEHVRAGLETVEWPCRLSVVSKNPFIIIDGAHNEDGIDSLKAAATKYLSGGKIILVIGMLRDKNYEYAVEQLAPLSHRVIATEPISPRALKAEEMAKAIRKYNDNVEAEADILAAIEKAKKSADSNSVVLICGSLYLAGAAYQYLMKN
jgi:dihydrofolate synthase/folylpolyglutamate synthase